jgi:naphthoate synthase/2-ketocyclohexanecarboxyl-CoA hydrolase
MEWTEWEPIPGPNQYEWQTILLEKKYHKELEGGVARMTWNRPPMNLINMTALQEHSVAFEMLSKDKSIGVIIVTGTGDKAFSAGGDVAWEEKEIGKLSVAPGEGFSPAKCRQPVIAAVKGWVVGYGNHFAYRCDLTIAADNARFAQNGPAVGSPADGYLVAYLIDVLGQKKAREMWMLCRRYTAMEALDMGLINAVAPLAELDNEVDKWCKRILELSPGCVEMLKASFESWTDHFKGYTRHEQRLMYPDWFEGFEIKEAQRSFLEKRPAYFWKARKKAAEIMEKAQEMLYPKK